MCNIINGGKHAGGGLKVQEFMIVPRGDIPFSEGLRQATTVYHHLGKLLAAKYGVSAKNLGDEGGYAPAVSNPTEAIAVIEDAIRAAGLEVGAITPPPICSESTFRLLLFSSPCSFCPLSSRLVPRPQARTCFSPWTAPPPSSTRRRSSSTS